MKAPRSGAVEENRIIVMEPRNPSVLREEAHTEQRKRKRTFMIRRRLNSIISTTAITTTYLPTYLPLLQLLLHKTASTSAKEPCYSISYHQQAANVMQHQASEEGVFASGTRWPEHGVL